ncbi:hypothetical protein [Gordonia sihwensis]|uniref:hypothetical protein n=1 Tax=Gordonia sihwensis TaxID=173559 RepID=UPI003D957E07
MKTISQYVKDKNITLTIVEDNGLQPGDSKEWPGEWYDYKVRIDYDGRSLTEGYRMGSALTDKPSAGMVLGTLVADARLYAANQDNMDAYSGEIGEDDPDEARKAYNRDRACYQRLAAWLPGGEDELNDLMFNYDDN